MSCGGFETTIVFQKNKKWSGVMPDKICENCVNIEAAKRKDQGLTGCDLKDVTIFCETSFAFSPFDLWCMTHPKTPIRGNLDCDSWKAK